MTSSKRWTKDELLVALNLYSKLRFGQFHERQRVIIEVAARMGRTPGSLAMKLGNLASLDPKLQARGIAGLPGASKLDREMWDELQAHRDALVPASEEAFRRLFDVGEEDELEVLGEDGVFIQPQPSAPEGPTSVTAEVSVRRGQAYFRQVVLNAFGGQCGVTGIAVRELLVASHIVPWAEYPEGRLDPQNGIALSRLHDAAFDRGLISFDRNYGLLLSSRLRKHHPQIALDANFSDYEGKPLRIASDAPSPNQAFLALHRKRWGFR